MSAKFDYGLLKLQEKIEDEDFIPLEEIVEKNRVNNLAVFGYPADQEYCWVVDKFGAQQILQWGLVKPDGLLEINKDEGSLKHNITTSSGQSGSPIISYNDDKNLSIIGIHVGGDSQMRKNNGCLINKELIERLKNKVIEWKGQMFTTVNMGRKITCSLIQELKNKPFSRRE